MFNTKMYNAGTYNYLTKLSLPLVEMPVVSTKGPIANYVYVVSPTHSAFATTSPAPSADDLIKRYYPITEGDATVCQSVADGLFAKWKEDQISISGIITLNVTLKFNQRVWVTVPWIGLDREMVVQKKSHELSESNSFTKVVCGDIILKDNELLARILDDLGA